MTHSFNLEDFVAMLRGEAASAKELKNVTDEAIQAWAARASVDADSLCQAVSPNFLLKSYGRYLGKYEAFSSLADDLEVAAKSGDFSICQLVEAQPKEPPNA